MNNDEALKSIQENNHKESRLTRRGKVVRGLAITLALLGAGATIASLESGGKTNNDNQSLHLVNTSEKNSNGIPENLHPGEVYLDGNGNLITVVVDIGNNPKIAAAFKNQNTNNKSSVTVTGENFMTGNGISFPSMTGSIGNIETTTDVSNGVITSAKEINNNYCLIFTGEKANYEPNYQEETHSSGMSGEYTISITNYSSGNTKTIDSGSFTANN